MRVFFSLFSLSFSSFSLLLLLPNYSLRVRGPRSRGLLLLGLPDAAREAADFVYVIGPEGDEAEQRRQTEEKDRPGCGARGRGAKGALLVEAVFFRLFFVCFSFFFLRIEFWV